MPGSEQNQRGFSLLEVMMAALVLSVGLLAVIGLFETGLKALQIGNNRTVAAQLAQNKMEELRLSNPTRVLNGLDPPLQGMTRSWTVEQSLKDPRIWVVSVDVTWKNIQNQDQSVSLKSFVFF